MGSQSIPRGYGKPPYPYKSIAGVAVEVLQAYKSITGVAGIVLYPNKTFAGARVIPP